VPLRDKSSPLASAAFFAFRNMTSEFRFLKRWVVIRQPSENAPVSVTIDGDIPKQWREHHPVFYTIREARGAVIRMIEQQAKEEAEA
jgi:hypothetical protein